MGIRQGKNETDKEYLDRVDEIIFIGKHVGDELQLHAVLIGLKIDSHMFCSMSKNFPATYAKFCCRAGDQITRQRVLFQRLGEQNEEEVVAPKMPSSKKKANSRAKKGGNYKAPGSFKKFEDNNLETKLTARRLKKEKKLKRPMSSSSPRKDLVLDSTNSSSESASEEESKMTQGDKTLREMNAHDLA
ncbi:hypothetical protein ACS0TY_014604 [Phlomoides rotata]